MPPVVRSFDGGSKHLFGIDFFSRIYTTYFVTRPEKMRIICAGRFKNLLAVMPVVVEL